MKKDTIGVCCLLVSTAMILMIAWFFQAHPVVASPENTRIMFIEIGGGEDDNNAGLPQWTSSRGFACSV